MDKEEKWIAPCGLYCRTCFAHEGKIADLARDLRKELRAKKFDRFADFAKDIPIFKELKDYDKAYKVMGLMVGARCKGCRSGGGNPFCAIRKCVERKKIDGCWQCDDFMDCRKNKFLEKVHKDAVYKNIKRIRKKGAREFLKGKIDR